MSSVEEMRTLLDSEEFDMRYSIGIGQSSSSMKFRDLDQIVQAFATHFAIISVKAELDQIVDGLKGWEVLQLIRSNPNKMRQLFLHEEIHITADIMFNMFRSNLSPTGSNQRELEEAVLLKWANYLQMIEGINLRSHFYCAY